MVLYVGQVPMLVYIYKAKQLSTFFLFHASLRLQTLMLSFSAVALNCLVTDGHQKGPKSEKGYDLGGT